MGRSTAAALLLLGTLAGCTSQGSTGSIRQTGALPTPEVLAATPNAAQVEYRIGPLDLLQISVFQVPDLSKTVKVSASG